MKGIAKALLTSLRFRFSLLVGLVVLTSAFSFQPAPVAESCSNCIWPDPGSGICVACTTDGCWDWYGCVQTCVANQETCGCSVGWWCDLGMG